GLVGEGLDQLDLTLGEGDRLRPTERDRTYGHSLANQWYRQHRPQAVLSRPRGTAGKVETSLTLQVAHGDRPPVENRPAGDHPAVTDRLVLAQSSALVSRVRRLGA